MKKYAIFITVFVLTISMLTGCGCTRRRDDMDTQPSQQETILPTIPDTIEPNVTDTVMPTYDSMEPSGTDAPTETTGTQDETGTSDSTGGAAEATGPAARSRGGAMQ